jgi:hypothetical protein
LYWILETRKYSETLRRNLFGFVIEQTEEGEKKEKAEMMMKKRGKGIARGKY